MPANRFVVTGSGRCGTNYMAKLLTEAGVWCGHEKAFNATGGGLWAEAAQADSSWMAVPHLPIAEPVVLLVRHPLLVVKSWVEIGFFSEVDAKNPTHEPLRGFAPEVYECPNPADRALAMWYVLNSTALAHSELVLRLETLSADQLARLLRWAGFDPANAERAFQRVGRTNRHEQMRRLTRVTHTPDWNAHNGSLAEYVRELAWHLGYDPDEVPRG